MAINEVNGKNVFDPGKRIRQAIGLNEANKMNLEALSRLGAAATNPVRVGVPDEKINYAKQIVHTNPMRPDNYNPPEELLQDYYKEPVKTKQTGTLLPVMGKGLTGLLVNTVVESSMKSDNLKDTFIGTAVASAIDVAGSLFASHNRVTLNTVKTTTSYPLDVKKQFNSERVKYTTQHLGASVLAPVAIKIALDKFLPEEIKEKTEVKFATSFGVLSTLGRGALSIARTLSNKSAEKNILREMKAVEKKMKEASTEKQELSLNLKKSFDNSLDAGIITGIIGSVVGKNTNLFPLANKNNPMIGNNESIPERFKPKTNIIDFPVIEIPVTTTVEKPATKVKPVTKPKAPAKAKA